MTKEYEFIPFENNLTENNGVTIGSILGELSALIVSCDFVVTDYNTMYSTDELRLKIGHRGLQLYDVSNFMFDWYYNIIGGYRLKKSKNE